MLPGKDGAVEQPLTTGRKYFASFGGLLLYMEGPHRKLSGLKIDDIYMLVKHS